MLQEDIDSKEETLRYINELNLYSYNNYSCSSCFNKGFLRGIEQLKLELNEYSYR